ncbi:hypothetical protein [Leptospira perdikensis]|uniref:Uncharacterized protein n=1 Tax=Leptospira perdikensis TaxID=2484948 RepID=A0A4R9JGW6_9LEPT|nr:hypothetical protein [Leptospira perdikensis]TGL41572.1 hypothetical protein EHQ49_08390 [Leptospira perdikensis]
MNRFLLIVLLTVLNLSLQAEPKTKNICLSLSDCESKADATEIHRKKITLLSLGITEYSKDSPIPKLIPLYLKRAKSIILEANGDTGYKGEVILKVSHKPEYKQSQLIKAEEDLGFLNLNKIHLSKEQSSELVELQTLLDQSK